MDFLDNDHVSRFDLTDELKAELDRALAQNEATLPQYWINKYKKDQQRNWELFYKRNEVNFFKDRTWLDREFDREIDGEMRGQANEENSLLLSSLDTKRDSWTLIDFGCGVGNALFPLITSHPKCTAYAFDVSSRAIEFLKARFLEEKRSSGLDLVGTWDLINDESPHNLYRYDQTTARFLPTATTFSTLGDAGLLLFVLSAIPPENVKIVLTRIHDHLKPGGILLFRDYAQYDHKEIRFAQRKQSKLGDHFYVRQDGTMALYFDKDELAAMLIEVGFKVANLSLLQRKFRNRKTNEVFLRFWLQGYFVKN